MTDRQYRYREIITKAVCGKGRKLITETNSIMPAHKPTSILGCWIINHAYKAKKKNERMVEIFGTYDVNLWYSYHENTKTEVVSEKIEYSDEIPLSHQDKNCNGTQHDIIIKVTKQPNCLQCKINLEKNHIDVEVEREFIVKVIGETTVNVKVEPTMERSSELLYAEENSLRNERQYK